MKKLLSLLLAAFSIGAMAQITVNVDVYSPSQVYPGVAVFLYEYNPGTGAAGITDPTSFTQLEYTSGNGRATFTVGSAVDTLYYGTFDCNGTFYQRMSVITPAINTIYDTLIYSTCAPTDCQTMLISEFTATALEVEAINLREFNWTSLSMVDHQFEVNGNYYYGSSSDSNYASITLFNSTFTTGPVAIYYERDTACTPTFDSLWYGGSTPSISCNADFFIDTVNSGVFNGQLILGENSSTSAGYIFDYMWDFGDGSVYNVQYPTHTYASTAASYNVCLTIMSTDGVDTCSSTYCDTITFDSTGAPVFKAGFTVNVVDPQAFSVDENLLQSLKLFPNPTAGNAVLTWDAALDVLEVDVYTINGQQVNSITPEYNEVNLTDLPSGVYFIRVRTPYSVAAQRLIVN